MEFCWYNLINLDLRSSIMQSLFHFAFNVTDLSKAREFYGELLQCKEGRCTDSWIDFDFYGHQISLHLGIPFKSEKTGKVGEHLVPIPHFGLILPPVDWQNLAKRLEDANIKFEISPSTRFKGAPGEQQTLFFRDFCGNPIEMKSFKDFRQVYK